MSEKLVNFKATKELVNSFNAEVKRLGQKNKDVLSTFISKFASNPKETLNFLGFEVEND